MKMSHVLLAIVLSGMATNSPDTVAKADKETKRGELIKVTPDVADINGYYICKGVEVGGKTYNGVCTITRKSDVYVVQWVIGSGSNFTGIGIRQGNTFAASWAIPGERGIVRGVNMYNIGVCKDGPKLTGRWASMPGPGALQSETLTFLKAMEEEEEDEE